MARSRIPSAPSSKSRHLPIPTTERQAAFVRLKALRNDIALYYNQTKADYVEGSDYTVWTINEWKGRFGGQHLTYAADQRSAVDPEGRHWEFFGYIIPLYDDPV